MVVLPLPVPPAMPMDDVAHGAASRMSLFFPNILPQAQGRCNLTFAFFAVKIKLAAARGQT